MNRPVYIAGHAFLFSVAVAISWVGISDMLSGGSLAQGLIRLAIAFVVVVSQARGIRADHRDALRSRGAALELP